MLELIQGSAGGDPDLLEVWISGVGRAVGIRDERASGGDAL
jgi:hypothetical protein